jgi:hypothetical protein
MEYLRMPVYYFNIRHGAGLGKTSREWIFPTLSRSRQKPSDWFEK